MNFFPFLYRRLQPIPFLVFVWLSAAAPVFAQAPAEEDAGASGPSAWVLPYGLVVFSLGLGLMMVLRSARRSDRYKPEQYASKSQSDD